MAIEFIGIAATRETSESGSANPAAGRDGISTQTEADYANGPVVQPAADAVARAIRDGAGARTPSRRAARRRPDLHPDHRPETP